jgi:hypothetical protein
MIFAGLWRIPVFACQLLRFFGGLRNDFAQAFNDSDSGRFHAFERGAPMEIETLIKAVKGDRNGHRDATMILIAYRRGLKASELCDLQ